MNTYIFNPSTFAEEFARLGFHLHRNLSTETLKTVISKNTWMDIMRRSRFTCMCNCLIIRSIMFFPSCDIKVCINLPVVFYELEFPQISFSFHNFILLLFFLRLSDYSNIVFENILYFPISSDDY